MINRGESAGEEGKTRGKNSPRNTNDEKPRGVGYKRGKTEPERTDGEKFRSEEK